MCNSAKCKCSTPRTLSGTPNKKTTFPNQSFQKSFFSQHKNDFSAMTCATIWDNVESEIKLFSGEKKNQIIITIKTSAQKHVILSLSHTHTQMLFILKKGGEKSPNCLSQNPLLVFPTCLLVAWRKGRSQNVRGHLTKMFDLSFGSACLYISSVVLRMCLFFFFTAGSKLEGWGSVLGPVLASEHAPSGLWGHKCFILGPQCFRRFPITSPLLIRLQRHKLQQWDSDWKL